MVLSIQYISIPIEIYRWWKYITVHCGAHSYSTYYVFFRYERILIWVQWSVVQWFV